MLPILPRIIAVDLDRPLVVAITERPHPHVDRQPDGGLIAAHRLTLDHHGEGAVLVRSADDQKGIRAEEAADRPGQALGGELQLDDLFAAGQLLGDYDYLAAVPLVRPAGQRSDVLARGERDDLRQRRFVVAQEVLPIRVEVPDFKADPLHHLKVVVEDELLDPLGAEAVADGLRSAQLVELLLPAVLHEDEAVGIGFGEDVLVAQRPTADGHLNLGGGHDRLAAH